MIRFLKKMYSYGMSISTFYEIMLPSSKLVHWPDSDESFKLKPEFFFLPVNNIPELILQILSGNMDFML